MIGVNVLIPSPMVDASDLVASLMVAPVFWSQVWWWVPVF